MSGLRRFLSSWQNILGLAIVAFYLLMAIAAPRLSPMVDPENPSAFQIVGRITDHMPRPPSPQAPLGTLPTQVDIFHALIWGSRSALAFGLTVALLSALIGILVGAAGAYLGGWSNNISMRVTDAFLAVPLVAGLFFFQQLFSIVVLPNGSNVNPGAAWWVGQWFLVSPIFPWLAGVDPMLLAFIFFLWMPYARIVNGLVLQNKETDYVHASRAMGASHARIILRHLIPNSITPAVVLVARDIGMVVLLQATFTFIGIGGNSPWGEMLVIGRNWIIGPGGNLLAWWWVFIPATLALLMFGIGWNLLGDGMNDWLNPRNASRAFRPAALPDRLQEISPASTSIIEEPEILAVEPSALPNWLVEAAPEELTTFNTNLEAPALEVTFTRPIEVSAQEAQAPSGAKLAAAALAGAGAAALARSREIHETPLIEEDTKPVRVSKPVPVKPEPTGAESLAAIAAAGLISQAAIKKSASVEEKPPETATPSVPAEEETDAAFAWLESLAAKQGAEEALLLKPEERLETPPAWVQEAIQADELNLTPAAEAAVKPTEEAAIPAEFTEALPDWLLEHEPEQPSGPSEAIAISMAAGVIPGWLKEMETPGAPLESASTEAALEENLPAEAPPELPSWLKEIETEPASSQPAELETWTPPPFEAIPALAALDLNQASLAEMERLPEVGFILAQAIVEHRNRNSAFKSVDDLQQVSGLSHSTFTDIRDHFVIKAPIAVTTTPLLGVEPPGSGVAGPSGKNLPAFDQARESLIQGDIQTAVDQYSALINSRQSLPDVIRDLNEATYRYPVEAPIWQTLGDAYMRSDQLQEALDAYTKAEELLR